jgi:hypothetical protein
MLREAGWTVLRIWETDVLRRTMEIADKVVAALAGRNPSPRSSVVLSIAFRRGERRCRLRFESSGERGWDPPAEHRAGHLPQGYGLDFVYVNLLAQAFDEILERRLVDSELDRASLPELKQRATRSGSQRTETSAGRSNIVERMLRVLLNERPERRKLGAQSSWRNRRGPVDIEPPIERLIFASDADSSESST